MAEAAVVQRPPNKFFCHQCSVEISPNLPDYTCPRCECGFIEEIEEFPEFDNAEESSHEQNVDPAAQFAELFGRSFLQSFQHHLDPNRPREDSDSETDDDTDLGTGTRLARSPLGSGLPASHPFQAFMGGPRISIRTRQAAPDGGAALAGHPGGAVGGQALQSILQSILSGLMGGGMPGGNQGGPGMGAQFPFGGMLSMYGNPGDYAWGTGGLDNIITQLLNQIEGTGPPPANKDEIDNLKEVQIDAIQTDKGMQCSVCMEDFKEGEKTKMLPCQHMYHPDCILPWLDLHGTCPVCRKPLSEAASPSTTVEDMEHSSTDPSPRSSAPRSRSSSRRQRHSDEYD